MPILPYPRAVGRGVGGIRARKSRVALWREARSGRSAAARCAGALVPARRRAGRRLRKGAYPFAGFAPLALRLMSARLAALSLDSLRRLEPSPCVLWPRFF